ncbi:MAG TPA: hypothetical protein VGO21_04270 [Candidatus Paceibacterota bacterium]|nr:hypothetical protein [Candidatus Paceibacterota bacterium]
MESAGNIGQVPNIEQVRRELRAAEEKVRSFDHTPTLEESSAQGTFPLEPEQIVQLQSAQAEVERLGAELRKIEGEKVHQ